MINAFRVLLISILICIPEVLTAAEMTSEELITEAREAYYRSDLKGGEGLLPLLGKQLESGPASGKEEDYISRSSLFLYKGLLELDQGNTPASTAAWEAGMTLCAEAVDRYGSEPLITMWALLKSRWMLLQNTRTIIKTGGEIQDLSDRALEMNPNSSTALLLTAQGLVNAPRLFGGDPGKAQNLLLESEALFREPHEKFDLYLTLASAARKMKDWEEGEMWCRKALQLYPENRQGLVMLASLLKRERS